MSNRTWRITDQSVIEALRENGFTCEHPQLEVTPGAIHFYTRHPDEDKDWWETNAPVEWNRHFELPDGRILTSSGTSLQW